MVPPQRHGWLFALGLILTLVLSSPAQSISTTSNARVHPARAAKLREIYGQAQQAAEKLTDYRVRLRRREIIAERQGAEELLMLTVRNKPFSVHAKCLPGSENEGRELIYVADKADAPLHVLTGKGDVIAGMHMEVGIHSERVKASSRHCVNEAGFGHAVERLGFQLDRFLSGQAGAGEFEVLGLQTRSESRVPMEVMIQHIPAKQEELLPQGGKRFWHFNTDPDAPERYLPTLVVTFDDRGQQVEYYFYDRLLPRVLLESTDFKPEIRWSRR